MVLHDQILERWTAALIPEDASPAPAVAPEKTHA